MRQTTPYMISYFRKIFYNLFPNRLNIRESKHFKDLANGPKIYIDGKPFVKVKLRFVDTFDSNVTSYIEKLENNIESDKSEIETLVNTNETLKQMISDLQNLNINSIREFKASNRKSELTINNLTDSLNNQASEIDELKKTVQDSASIIEFMKEQIIVLESRIVTKDSRIRSLEAKLQYLKSFQTINNITKKEIGKHKRKPNQSLYPDIRKNKQIEERDLVIKILIDKEKDYQKKIEMLQKEIESLQNRLKLPQ